MRIKSLNIKDFKGIPELRIQADCKNIAITGENGAGKSSIFHAWQFVLGDTVKDVNRYGTDHAVVQVTFDNDLTLCREYLSNYDTKNKYFIDNMQVKEADYKSFIKSKTAGLDPKIFSQLGYFATMDLKSRRNILMSMCNVKNEDVLAKNEEFAEVYDKIQIAGIEEFRKSLRSQAKVLKEKLQAIPYEIKGLQYSQQDDLGDKPQLLEELSARQAEHKKLSADIQVLQQDSPPTVDTNRLNELNRLILNLQVQLDNSAKQIEKLRAEYAELAASRLGGPTCPTCKQPLPTKNRDYLLSLKIKEAEKINANRQLLKVQLQKAQAELQELQNAQSHYQTSSHCQRLASHFQEKLLLERTIGQLQHKLQLIHEQDHRNARIAELQKEQLHLQNRLGEIEYQLQLLKDFQLTKNRLIESQVNSFFHSVKFKLFDYYVTTGEIKDCCEVLLDGRPYGSALSKGERLKASLDCLRSLQEHFKVELPIFIDDFESYTSNSLLLSDLHNQLFTFKAVDGQNLSVKVVIDDGQSD